MSIKYQVSGIKYYFIGYILTIFALFIYSYTQIDLNLTLSKYSFWQPIEHWFKSIGYFNRPLSTAIYLVILALFFGFYFLFLNLAQQKKITQKQTWILIITTAVILAFSYNAFSYDIFNYIFDAKIITFYHQNPYLQKALDYPGDPMLNFMRWTHRTFPYGPGWLLLTVPFSFIGSNIFLPTFFLFKFLAAAAFLGTSYFIFKILKKITPGKETFGLILFALNPLVIIESLVSAHNDISMMFFAVLAIYLFLGKKWIFSVILISFSFLIKQVTAVLLLPFFIYAFGSSFSKKLALSTENFFRFCMIVSILALFYILFQKEMQPWYFLWILPFVSLIKPNKYLISLSSGLSLGLLLRYAPFLYLGDWNGIAIPIRFYVTIVAPVVFLLATIIFDKFIKDLRSKI